MSLISDQVVLLETAVAGFETALTTAFTAKANASAVGTMAARDLTVSTGTPTGGEDGDVWLQPVA